MGGRFQPSLGGNSLFPVLAMLGIVFGLSVLALQVAVRPWAGPDTGTDTHLNYSEPSADYSRSSLALVDAPAAAPEGWRPGDGASAEAAGLRSYLGYGCASCHGLLGEGGWVGPKLTEASPSEIRKKARNGPEGMPAFGNLGLPDKDLALIAEYIVSHRDAAEAAALDRRVVRPVAAPIATPWPSRTPQPTAAAASPAAPALSSTPAAPAGPVPIAFDAAAASIVVDGDPGDWAGIDGAQVQLQQIKSIPGREMGTLPPVEATLKVANDADRVYVLVEVPDDFDYVPGDRSLSAKAAVMFRIDPPAAPHMGTTEEEQKKSLGKVDIWHWTLDCGPGEPSGGGAIEPGGVAGGNDRVCNLDDEYAATPTDLEDDGSPDAENSLLGVWEHTGRAGGQGADGTWVFEYSRPLQTGDPDDAQLMPGSVAAMALAYWDPDETPDGWTDLGHLQSAGAGWIKVTLSEP